MKINKPFTTFCYMEVEERLSPTQIRLRVNNYLDEYYNESYIITGSEEEIKVIEDFAQLVNPMFCPDNLSE